MAGDPPIKIRNYYFRNVTNSTHVANTMSYDEALAKTYALDAGRTSNSSNGREEEG